MFSETGIQDSHTNPSDVQYNFNASNTFVTIKLCSRHGEFELVSVNHSVRSGTY